MIGLARKAARAGGRSGTRSGRGQARDAATRDRARRQHYDDAWREHSSDTGENSRLKDCLDYVTSTSHDCDVQDDLATSRVVGDD